MVNYQNGKIYAIRSFQTNQVYIGSTTQVLCERLAGHKRDYKVFLKGNQNYISSYELVKYEDAYIELIELFPCNTKEELLRKEGQVIRDTDCANKQIPGRTKQEYYQDNKETIIEKRKEYYQDNKETIIEKKKEYYQENKEILCEKSKEYRKDNHEYLLEYDRNRYDKRLEERKDKITCECGIQLCKGQLCYHRKSKQHLEKMNKTVELIVCECGCELTYQAIYKHKKSQKHASLMEEKKNIIVANEKVVE